MHVHLSALSAIITFFYVIVVGAMWRYVSIRLAASSNESLQHVGQAMSSVY